MTTNKFKVLVVDDSQMIRDSLKDNLANMGFFKVDTAADGEIAVRKAEDAIKAGEAYELIFLDWNMPVMDGFEALKLIRAMKPMENCFIAMLSAENESENIKMALAAGANIFINKPFNQAKLKVFVENLSKTRKT
jgi:two-component system chemotaxis response regulator CheY